MLQPGNSSRELSRGRRGHRSDCCYRLMRRSSKPRASAPALIKAKLPGSGASDVRNSNKSSTMPSSPSKFGWQNSRRRIPGAETETVSKLPMPKPAPNAELLVSKVPPTAASQASIWNPAEPRSAATMEANETGGAKVTMMRSANPNVNAKSSLSLAIPTDPWVPGRPKLFAKIAFENVTPTRHRWRQPVAQPFCVWRAPLLP